EPSIAIDLTISRVTMSRPSSGSWTVRSASRMAASVRVDMRFANLGAGRDRPGVLTGAASISASYPAASDRAAGRAARRAIAESDRFRTEEVAVRATRGGSRLTDRPERSREKLSYAAAKPAAGFDRCWRSCEVVRADARNQAISRESRANLAALKPVRWCTSRS